jgi:hypothetical protein
MDNAKLHIFRQMIRLLLYSVVFPGWLAGGGLCAQPKYFEGELQYQVSANSRQEGLSDQDIYKMLALGPSLTVYMKEGHIRRSSSRQEEYYVPAEKKVYVKFARLDTLYWMDYSADTSTVTGIDKPDSIFNVDHYPCRAITIRTANVSWRYYYSPDLLKDPKYDSANTIGHFDIFNRETGGAVYLWVRSEYPFAVNTDSCVRVEVKKIDDHVFDLPALPQKKFEIGSLIRRAKFPGNANSWLNYLQSNLDSKLAIKYVKLPKGQDEASVTVYVTFVVSESGLISHVTVVNPGEVPSKLAAEAARVIQESPRWQPMEWYGEKVSTFVKQPVVFKVTK